jgi:hypothetical protein
MVIETNTIQIAGYILYNWFYPYLGVSTITYLFFWTACLYAQAGGDTVYVQLDMQD